MENENKNIEQQLSELTPTEYFDKLKGMKKDITEDDIHVVLNNCLQLMEKPKLTGQKKMAKKIYEQAHILIRELSAVKAGFQKYVLREDILYYIQEVANKTVKIIELENYERDIPDEVIDRLVQAKPYFDEFFIVFTDYTGEAERIVAKEKRDKDPILFGVLHHPDKKDVPTNRMYFIADWVDEYCDLTLEELCIQYEGNVRSGFIHEHKIPENIEELKQVFELQESESTIKTVDEISTIIGNNLGSVYNSKNNTPDKPKKKKSTFSKTTKKTTTKKSKKSE
jgi:hypothetical protein